MNPWKVSSVEDFNFLCCPECVFRSKETSSFEAHALKNHPLASTLFGENDYFPPKCDIKLEPDQVMSDSDPLDINNDIGASNEDIPEKTEATRIETQLKIHIQKCDTDKLTCKECSKIFCKREALMKHKRTTHENIARTTYHCCACNETFQDTANRVKHENVIHPDIKNHRKCSACDKTFDSLRQLRQHVTKWHDRIDCKICNRKVLAKDFYKNHIDHPKELFECDQCSEKHFTKGALTIHEKTAHGKSKNAIGKYIYHCMACNETFEDTAERLVHQNAVHPDMKNHRKCSVCERTFDTHADLRIHVNKYHKFHRKHPSLLECGQCSEKYINRTTLIRHERIAHGKFKNAIGKYIYHCMACNETFEDALERLKHENTVHPDMENHKQCSLCEKTLDSNADLRIHIKKQHDCVECGICNRKVQTDDFHKSHIEHPEELFECDQCSEKYFTQMSLTKHERTTHGKVKDCPVKYIYYCLSCNETFRNTTDRLTHEKSVHPDKRNQRQCLSCNKTFETHYKLRLHAMQMHDSAECGICNQIVPRWKIDDHIMKHKNSKLTCDKCSYATSSMLTMNLHNKNCYFKLATNSNAVKRTDIGKVTCPTCNLETEDLTFVKHHQSIHKCLPPGIPEANKFICEQCSKEFLSHNALNEHLRRIHLPNSNRNEPDRTVVNLKCEHCGLICLKKSTLLEHYRRVHKSYPSWFDTSNLFPCSYCGDLYQSKALNTHIRNTHEKKRVRKQQKRGTDKQTCETCGKVFSNNESCRLHVLSVHMNHNPYKCPECPMKFPVAARLKNHMNVKHTRLTCDICQDVLYNEFNMKEHKYKVHGILPQGALKCDQCDKIFLNTINLKKHETSKH